MNGSRRCASRRGTKDEREVSSNKNGKPTARVSLRVTKTAVATPRTTSLPFMKQKPRKTSTQCALVKRAARCYIALSPGWATASTIRRSEIHCAAYIRKMKSISMHTWLRLPRRLLVPRHPHVVIRLPFWIWMIYMRKTGEVKTFQRTALKGRKKSDWFHTFPKLRSYSGEYFRLLVDMTQ